VKVRPTAATDRLLLSLPRTGQPPRPLGTRDIARIVERYAAAAGLPDDRRSRHVLRHTFCTHLADSGADTAVIRELAGHADIRTTTIQPPTCPPKRVRSKPAGTGRCSRTASPAKESARCRRSPTRR
jgi:integrase